MVANVIAFIFAVTFAYITNKLFVFESKSWDISVLRQEIPQFFGARLLSFLFEELGLLICDNMLGLGRYHLFSIWKISVDGVLLSKVILSVFVVIINYFFCKFLIFKKKIKEPVNPEGPLKNTPFLRLPQASKKWGVFQFCRILSLCRLIIDAARSAG